MNTATITRTATRNATITNNRADLHQFFTNPTGILATGAVARAIVSALTDTTTFDDIFYLTGETNGAKGFIYRMPQGGDNYTAIEIKRHGEHRTSITTIANHYSPNQEVLDHRIIARDQTLDHFITHLKAHAK
ncbi:hypothetical protein SEA_PSONYX_128 [Corynebacterium phage PSonyx]|nr:hypothetical protein SEA_PSONYX_128 [Corynebacterium phage PSonyx]